MPLPPIQPHEVPEGSDPTLYGRDLDAPLPPERPVPMPAELPPALDPVTGEPIDEVEALNQPGMPATPPIPPSVMNEPATLSGLLTAIETEPYVPKVEGKKNLVEEMHFLHETYKSEISALEKLIRHKRTLLKATKAFIDALPEDRPARKKPKPKQKRVLKAGGGAVGEEPVEPTDEAPAEQPDDDQSSDPDPGSS